MREFPKNAIERAKQGALNWLEDRQDGYPRSWKQEDSDREIRGYELYDDFEAPPIAGYEALEKEGLVRRGLTIQQRGQERVHFQLVERACGQGAPTPPKD